MRCRQPEKILLPPELTILLAEPVELGSLLAGEEPLVARSSLAPVNAGQPDPTGQAAGGKPKPLGDGVAGEALLQAELHGLRLLLRREQAPGSGGVGHRWTVWWSWRDPYRLVLKTGGTPPSGSRLVEMSKNALAVDAVLAITRLDHGRT